MATVNYLKRHGQLDDECYFLCIIDLEWNGNQSDAVKMFSDLPTEKKVKFIEHYENVENMCEMIQVVKGFFRKQAK